MMWGEVGYAGSALEDQRLVARAFGIGKGANGLGGFVVEAGEHFM
jgi:hypothetical protein